jgi:hypothetical protein
MTLMKFSVLPAFSAQRGLNGSGGGRVVGRVEEKGRNYNTEK